MAKNKITEVAKILGLELEEEFKISTSENLVYKLSENGLFYRGKEDHSWWKSRNVFEDLIVGTVDIVKIPWKPRIGVTYWYATSDGLSYRKWDAKIWDLAYYVIGNCFRTKEEAEKHGDEVLRQLSEIYLSDKKPILKTES